MLCPRASISASTNGFENGLFPKPPPPNVGQANVEEEDDISTGCRRCTCRRGKSAWGLKGKRVGIGVDMVAAAEGGGITEVGGGRESEGG